MRRRVIACAALAATAAALVGVRWWPREPILARYPASTAVYASNGELLRLTLAADGNYRLPVKLEEISPRLVNAVLLHEDRQFRWHPGVNPWALARGAVRTYFVGDRRIGGSTITMQLARRVYGIESNRVPGKIAQIFRALELEAKYSKHDILEAYLNLAPYGGNVEGAGAASLVYFHRRAALLTLPEALALAVIPQSPARRTPLEQNPALDDARQLVFAEWRDAYGTTARDQAMMDVPLAAYTPRELPFRAPHATQALLAQATPDTHDLRTTLEPRLQRLLERQVRGYIERQSRFGVTNAAVMLVDRRDLSVRAAIGSANFLDAAIGGQNDGTRARRSPGSTLKPFVYALAMQQGLVHPQTVLEDRPQAFGPFAPENFDGDFAGPVTVQDALIRSRNIPAVKVGMELANPSFHQFLRTAGVGGLAPESHYGLAVYLGGAEVTMRELVALYGALANGGELRPLRDLVDAPQAPPVRILSPEASYIALDMLTNNPRPAQAFANGAVRVGAPVAWKTGTSNGFRDAWTVGVFDQYVLAVWIGNFDGRPNPAFVGVHVAAPLFFQIVDALRATNDGQAIEPVRPPDTLRRVEVCAGSGDLPDAFCPRRVRTWYIPGVSPIRASTLHRELRVDVRTGKQACAGTPEQYVRREVHEFWSSDMLALFARSGLPRRSPPPVDGSCPTASGAGVVTANGRDPFIESPVTGVEFVMRDGRLDTPLALKATTEPDVNEVYWFANEAYVGRSRPSEVLEWRPAQSGSFVLRVVDDAGRSQTRPVRVAGG